MPEGFLAQLRNDPAVKGLLENATSLATAKIGSIGQSKQDNADTDKVDEVKGGAISGVGDAVSEGKNKLFGGIKGALKGLFKRGGSAKRPTNIYEQLFIGVPVAQAYENWTEYSKFPEFMKGPESVKVSKEEGEDGEVKETHQWTAKIFLNRRSWKATVEEDVENSRIRWSTEAAKGTIDGAISFTPIGENATLMVYTLEYRPKGFFEWWGNRWRTVGRRARLDVKHFGRYVMMQDQTSEEDEAEEEDESAPDGPSDTDVELDDAPDSPSDTDVELDDGGDDASPVASDDEEPEQDEPEPETERPRRRRRPRDPEASARE